MRSALLAFLWLVGVVGFAVGCRSPEERAAYHLRRGHEFVAAEKTAAAKIEFRSALSFDPKSVEANFELADLAEAEGNRHDAIFYLRDALNADPRNHDLMLRLATLLRDDEPWRARKLLMTAISEDPSDPVAHLGLSQLELSIGRPDEALASAQRAIELDENIPGTYWQLGIIYESLIERATKSSAAFDESLRDNAVAAFDAFVAHGGEPEWKARLEQARVLAAGQRNRAAAITAARRALEVARMAGGDQPKLLAARHLSAVARAARDRVAYADATEAMLEVTPRDFHAWKNLAELREASGGSAEEVYRELLAQFPGDADAHALYARHLGLTQSYFAAVRYYEKVIDEGIEPTRLLSSLRSYQIAYRMMPHAQKTLERMQNEFPGDPWTRLEEAKDMSTQGQAPAAIEILERLVAEYEIPEAFEVLARLEQIRKRHKQAAEYARRAVDLTGYYEIRLHRLLAEALFDAGLYADHVDEIELIEKYDDLTNDQWLAKASSLYATDRPEEARKILFELVEDPEMQIAATLEFARHEAINPKQALVARKLVIAALASHPEDRDLLIAHADVNLQMGRPDLALVVLDKLDPKQYPPTISYMRARLRANQKNVDGALTDLAFALRADPSLPGLMDFAMLLYRERGIEAPQTLRIAEWIKALRVNGATDWLINSRKIAHLQLLRSRLMHSIGRNDDAIEILERAIASFEFFADTRIDLAYLLTITGKDVGRAIEIGEEVIATPRPDPRALDALGFAYLNAKQPSEALRNLHRANLAVNHTNPLFLYHESIALRELGRDREALRAIEQVIALDPKFPNAIEFRKTLLGSAPAQSEPS